MTGRRRRAPAPDPFGALGLTPGPDLTDEDVRAAWRRVASDTHPDREDGGDPARFAAAAAAYTALRTPFSRGEALADLTAAPRSPRAHRPAATAFATLLTPFRHRETPPEPAGGQQPPAPTRAPRAAALRLPTGPRAVARLTGRVRRGRPLRLTLRILAAAAASVAAVAAAGPHPAAPALVTGAVTWLVLTARQDLAPPGGPP